jgi:DNA-binding IclR family transcriptional regulator
VRRAAAQAVGRAVDTLDALLSRPDGSTIESVEMLGRDLDLARCSIYRHFLTLRSHRYLVENSTGTWSLSWTPIQADR